MTGEYESSTTRPRRGHASTTAALARLAALLLAGLGLVVVGGGAASAHTPSVDATCERLSVRLTSYQGSGTANTVQVVIDGTTMAESAFGTSYQRDFTFADAAVPHTWSVAVTAADDPDGSRGWTVRRSGTTTPCAPPDACPTLPGDQPAGTSCTQPGDEVEVRWLDGAPDCSVRTVTNTKQSRSRTYSWDGAAWTPGPWSPWVTVTTETVPTTPEACPATQVTAAEPAYAPPTCASGPSLSYAPGEGYRWEVTGPPEARVLTAVADDGHTLVGQTVFGPYDTTPWSTEQQTEHGCLVAPGEPVVTQAARCDALGSVTPPTGEHLALTISGGRWSDLPAGDYVVTATLVDGASGFADAAAHGWQVSGRTATRTITILPARSCVTPDVSVLSAACVPGQAVPAVGGRLVVVPRTGIAYTVRDTAGTPLDPGADFLPPGTYVVTATAAEGYELTDANGFQGGVRTVEVPATATACAAVAIPVQPSVRAVDRCGTADDRVVFDRENRYWTAEITDGTHVTFTAKGAFRFADDGGGSVDRVVLSYPPLTDDDCPPLPPGDNPPGSDSPPGLHRPPTAFEEPPLPNTGGPSAWLGGLALLLLLTGAALVRQGRRSA